jgi:hypothetical protein
MFVKASGCAPCSHAKLHRSREAPQTVPVVHRFAPVARQLEYSTPHFAPVVPLTVPVIPCFADVVPHFALVTHQIESPTLRFAPVALQIEYSTPCIHEVFLQSVHLYLIHKYFHFLFRHFCLTEVSYLR